jgi:uncharacterized membrane protein YhhN
VGLGLCLIGDILKIDMTRDKTLYAAMAVFAMALLIYAVVFTRFNGFRFADWIVAVVFLIIFSLVIRLYWKGLGKLKLPVILFGLVMLFMVTRAISTLFGDSFSLTSAIMVSLGAILVLLGVIEYGVHRFHEPVKFFYGPVCYAAGELLLALSCSYFNL